MDELNKLNNQELIELSRSLKGLKRLYLYPELAKRTEDKNIQSILFNDILNKEYQKLTLSVRGNKTLAWMAIIEILNESDELSKRVLKPLISTWDEDDQISFKEYLKIEPNFFKYIE